MNWNDDILPGTEWANVSGDETCLWTMMHRAWRERVKVLGYGVTDYDPAPGESVAQALVSFGASTAGPPMLQWRIQTSEGLGYVRTGGYYDPEGESVVEGLVETVNPATGNRSPVAVPYPDGFSRRWSRTIYTLSQPGSAGQRALFTYWATIWTSCPTTDPLHGTLVTTPASEGKYSGRYFDHDGTQWVESPDQISLPDTVEETGVRYWYRGDLVDNKMLEETREALNQMTVTVGFYTPVGPLTSLGPQLGFECGLRSSATEISERAGVSYDSQAAADADFNDDPGTVSATSNTSYDFKRSGATQGFTYSTWRKVSNIIAPLNFQFNTFPPPPNPDAKSREVSFWIRAKPAGTWDDYGSGFPREQWHEVGPRQLTATTESLAGPTINEDRLDDPASQPWPTTGERGWTLTGGDVAILCRWDVEGGFRYTYSTTGD